MGPGMGQGMMGPGMGQGMMGPGMGQGGQGMRGPGWRGQPLSTSEVERMLAYRLLGQGFTNLEVGAVEETGEDSIIAEVVTRDGSPVQRFEFDRQTGAWRPLP